MLLQNPLEGEIAPDKRFYEDHPKASGRPSGTRKPLVTLDFGPTDLKAEPSFDWKGGEVDILGRPIAAKRYDHFHKAIDISTGGCFDPVFAAAKGVVTMSEKNDAGVKVIVIEHDPIDGHRYETRYAHLDQLIAKVRDEVDPGEVIGKLGKTGADKCHLHFALRKDGRPVDPWRRLAQNTAIDPDLPATTSTTTTHPATLLEDPDVPMPASNEEYLAGSIAIVGNTSIGAKVREAPEVDGVEVRTIPGGVTEEWRPTCWVKGDVAFGSDRWLTRWFNDRWEFTHFVNVGPVTRL
jgi:hypothetical protein